MANKPAEPSSQGTLQRGKACLRCRKRKMRCDGAKPACQQCIRAKKTENCEYDDGKGKTRTQMMRETIAKLETRIRDLEDHSHIPPVTLFDPHHSRSSSASSSFGSPKSAFFSSSHSPFPPETVSPLSSAGAWGQTASAMFSEVFADEHMQHPTELYQMLIDIFAPHARQCGLQINIARLRASLQEPASEQRHPVLMNAIYLWACFISRPGELSQHESHYLQQALSAIPDALTDLGRVVDVIQASCLIANYYLASGRFVEGNYHASAAAALCLQVGLDKPTVLDAQPGEQDSKPSKSGPKDGERILAFWQVYNLDRCWSVVLRKPGIIPTTGESRVEIYCPWPQEIGDYEAGFVDTNVTVPTIGAFLSGAVDATGFSNPALRAKASALFYHAEQLSMSWGSGAKPSTEVLESVRNLEHTIALFLSTLIPINQLEGSLPGEKTDFILIHTLAQAALIHLHRTMAHQDPASFTKSSQAARTCVSIMKQIGEQDFPYLEPITGPCWWCVADILLRDLDTVESSWPLGSHSNIQEDLQVVLFSMTALSRVYPVVAPVVAKLQKRLA